LNGSDPIWEQKYASGHRQRYPWDLVVSFIFRNAPKDGDRSSVAILEVGCGTAPNLWFAAREGFQVAGIDSSASAVAAARASFAEEGLKGDIRVADFTALPFEDATFDLAVDRSAITCVGRSAARRAIAEVRRVLKPGGKFLFNPYGDSHSSAAAGRPGPDGLTLDIDAGTLVGAGAICFYGRGDILDVFGEGWAIEAMERCEIVEERASPSLRYADWRVVAKKLD